MDPAWPTKGEQGMCDTCGKEPMTGADGLTEMPASAGMGGNVLRKVPSLFDGCVSNVAALAAGGVRDRAAYETWLDRVNTYVDGSYMTLREALARHPITQEEIARQAAWQAAHWPKSR